MQHQCLHSLFLHDDIDELWNKQLLFQASEQSSNLRVSCSKSDIFVVLHVIHLVRYTPGRVSFGALSAEHFFDPMNSRLCGDVGVDQMPMSLMHTPRRRHSNAGIASAIRRVAEGLERAKIAAVGSVGMCLFTRPARLHIESRNILQFVPRSQH